MDLFNNLAIGFGVAITPINLLYAFIGCVLGTLIGVLPGIGPVATIAMLLPITFHLPPTAALIMLAGIYYGAQYGGSTTSILVNLPGEASSVVTCIDGYQMTLKGKCGTALFTAGVSSFIGGTVAIIVLAWLAPALGEVAFLFGPSDYCALMLVGFVCVSFVTTGSLLNGLAMCFIGVLLGQVGTDVNSGMQRFTLDLPFLMDGIGLVSIALGCFGIAEITKNLDNREERTPFQGHIKLIPTWPEFKRIIPSALRGSLVGSFMGILPGGGTVIAQFAAYAVEKKVSKYGAEIGHGAIEGVAGFAAADEAAARTSFIPLMSIGIPENAVMALMMAAFIIKGIQPGPNMIASHPDLFWGLVASMWVGNVFLVIMNVPMVRYLLTVFKIPYNVLYPCILFFCCIGTYSVNNNLDDIYITAVFGLLGYLFMRLDLDAPPLLLGFILGPMLEENFRRAMLLSRGSFATFVDRPISGTLLGLLAVFIAWNLFVFVRTTRRQIAAGRAPVPAREAEA